MDSITRGGLIHGGRIPSCFLPPLRKPTPLPKNFSFSTPATSRSSISRSSSAATDAIIPMLKSAAGTMIFTAATTLALLAGKFSAAPPAVAAPRPPPATEDRKVDNLDSSLSELLDSSDEAVDTLRSLVYQKLENNEDSEALSILYRLIAARPSDTEWKFLAARLLNEMDRLSDSRVLYEEILASEPLNFEALFQNSVLMDRCGEGDAALQRLEKAVERASVEKKEKEARDVRLLMAQMKFLQKKVDEALEMYEELGREDTRDYRPWFCQGVIYSLLGKDEEARESFARCKQVCPEKFEVEGFVQTPLSRMKLFGVGGGGGGGGGGDSGN